MMATTTGFGKSRKDVEDEFRHKLGLKVKRITTIKPATKNSVGHYEVEYIEKDIPKTGQIKVLKRISANDFQSNFQNNIPFGGYVDPSDPRIKHLNVGIGDVVTNNSRSEWYAIESKESE